MVDMMAPHNVDDVRAQVAEHGADIRTLSKAVQDTANAVLRLTDRVEQSDKESAARIERMERATRPNIGTWLTFAGLIMTFGAMVWTLTSRFYDARLESLETQNRGTANSVVKLDADLQREMRDLHASRDAKLEALKEALHKEQESVRREAQMRFDLNRQAIDHVREMELERLKYANQFVDWQKASIDSAADTAARLDERVAGIERRVFGGKVDNP